LLLCTYWTAVETEYVVFSEASTVVYQSTRPHISKYWPANERFL